MPPPGDSPACDAPPLHVVAAVLRDPTGRVLLSQRAPGRDLAGLWEFPGGKREADECSESALRRELAEELGIDAGAMRPLISVPHRYPQQRIVLETFEVDDWRGQARGCEGQALAWVATDFLRDYPMPAADRPILAVLRETDRYLITPAPGANLSAFLLRLRAALSAGVRRVQLRAPDLGAPAMRQLATEVSRACSFHRAELLLSSRCSAALELASELRCGLHLTAADLVATMQRPDVGPGCVAASCHDAAELAHAEAIGCDFVVVGPLAATPSHPDARPLGWEGFRRLRERSGLPIYALGGMQVSDLATARSHGAQGIAAIRGLWPSSDDAWD